ncbi:MAG: FHA domain-containing protein, partial [Pseudolysinimonas sp.]
EPTLISLPSPSKELSSTHLELKVVGGALVASDMRSTNGTVVQLPGVAPRTLIRGESAVVPAGTRIDLGEGAVLGVLAPRVVEAEPS